MTDYLRTRRPELYSDRRVGESEGFFCKFTFGQFFALLVLEVLTLFFVFYLGARYGREFLGLGAVPSISTQANAPQEGGEALEAKVLTTSDPQASEIAKDLIAKANTPELKDRISRMFEGAKGEESVNTTVVEPVKENIPSDEAPTQIEQGPATVVRPPSVPVTETTSSQPTDIAGQVTEETQVPSPVARGGKELDTAGSSIVRVKSAENARYSVQVGAYPQINEATRVVEKWKTKGYPAYMMIAEIPDRGQWYRVRIGGFNTRGDAQRYLKEFQSRENVEALVVMNEQ